MYIRLGYGANDRCSSVFLPGYIDGLVREWYGFWVKVIARGMGQVRGVLGNKCAGHYNLKTVHFRETLASDDILACSSAISVFFCSALSTTGQLGQAFM